MTPKCKVLLIGFICLLTIGCDDVGLDYGYFISDPRKPTFKDMKVEIFVNKDNYAKDSIITITTSCQPLFNGKGRIILDGGINGENCYEIQSPIQRKVCKQDDPENIYPLIFDTSQISKIDWVIKMKLEMNYTAFHAIAVLDSIIVEDSCDLFVPEYDCETALREYREELKFNPLRARSETIYLSN